MGSAKRTGKPASWFDRVDERLRRLEIAVACLVVATASPKVGGPAPADVVAGAASLARQLVA